MKSTNFILHLEGQKILKRSGNYDIYDHPEIAGILVKVRAGRSVRRHIFRRFADFRYGDLRQVNREANEYLAAMHRRVPGIIRVSGFFGFAMSDKGPALLSEKMTDGAGALAPTVSEMLNDLSHSDPERQHLKQEFSVLLDELERSRIIVGDLSLDNVVRASERNNQLVVIDGIGERTLIPLTLFSDLAFRRSMKRRRRRLLALFDGNSA